MAILTQYWGLDGLLLFFCIIIGIYLYFTRNFKYWKKLGVKEIPPTVFFGNLGPCLLAKRSIIDVLQDMYDVGKNELFIGYYVLDKPHLLLRDPELIKHVLIKDFNYFSSRNATSRSSDIVGKMNLFVVRNPEWKYIRQKLSPIFTSGRLKKMFELMLEIEKDFSVYLESLNLDGNGRPLDIKEICAKYTTDLIGITAYGMKFNSLLDPDALLRKVGKDIFGRTYRRHIELFSAILIPELVKAFGIQIFGNGATNFLKKVFWEAIDQRIKSGAKRADLIDLLIDLKKEQENDSDSNKIELQGDALVAQAAIFFTGGFETSSTTMTYTLYELAKAPELQEKLRKEILDILSQSDGMITYDMITSQLPYLDMVVSETLRMYPILPFLDRVANMDYEFPGTKLTVKAGSSVVIPLYAIQNDPQYFSKPRIFDPERFSPENKRNIKPNTYFPFGDGPRVCIGMRLGLLQMKLALVHLLSKYKFSPSKETPIPLEFDNLSVFTHSAENIILNVQKICIK
ncbi:cytochrome P450 6k1-like [Phymastichus coffea]|uniref:cytochrome P450 6k1-like n=1 Tax=Phymastichus coffea TaxID=108790 RepID=UPI00273CB671|nr:cytochrome P450 6k1-like [Phymastichus coffea]